LVTTNSITQEFSRRVIAQRFKGKPPISLLFAIPDHPWTKATREAAAVRIAMTVGAAGEHEGVLREVIREEALETDEPIVELSERKGRINADLTIGVDATTVVPLRANEALCSRGIIFLGEGFIIPERAAKLFGEELENGYVVKDYISGRDLTGLNRGMKAIDLDGFAKEEVRSSFPRIYQHLLQTVKPLRDRNRETYRRENWWLFGRRNTDMRASIKGIKRYIATVQTAKHRLFSFERSSVLADQTIIVIGSDDSFILGVLSSRIHVVWTLNSGGTLEDRPRYSTSACFDPFPFPDPPEELKARIRAKAEELDAHRKRVQAEHPELTLTQLYNVLQKLRAGAELTPAELAIRDIGLVLILKEIHDELDVLVFEAYGWPKDLSDEEILSRLVVLNKARAEEEKRGVIRWLRPDYQKARAGVTEARKAPAEEQLEATLVTAAAKVQKPSFPTDPVAQTAAVMAALAAANGPLDAAALAAGFRQGKRVEKAVHATLLSLHRLGHLASDGTTTFALRRAA
jgi:hypothetical protein